MSATSTFSPAAAEAPPERGAPAPHEASSQPGQSWSSALLFFLLAGGLFAFNGVATILIVLQKPQMLWMDDPVLGIPLRWTTLSVGVVEILMAGLCLFTRNRAMKLWLLAWLTVNLLVYRAGLWSMDWHHPYGFVGPLANSLNCSPLQADLLLAGLSLFLVIGSLAVLLSRWRHPLDAYPLSTINSQPSAKMSCPACGGHIRFSIQNLGREIPCPHCCKPITLRRPENIKMSCFFCHGRIEFPAHALGTKMACPHCRKDITLKETKLS